MSLNIFHTITQNITSRELKWRDEFWASKLPQRVPAPNVLTISRIIGSVLILFLNLGKEVFFLFVILLFLTDYFDGIIARTRDKETDFGKWADPMADKILLLAIIYFLYSTNPLFWSKFLIWILIPEILILVLGFLLFLLKKPMNPEPNLWGRLKLTFYFFGILLFILNLYSLTNIFIWVAIAFAFVSVIHYFFMVKPNSIQSVSL